MPYSLTENVNGAVGVRFRPALNAWRFGAMLLVFVFGDVRVPAGVPLTPNNKFLLLATCTVPRHSRQTQATPCPTKLDAHSHSLGNCH